MKKDMDQLLIKKQFPRSSRYETDWMLDNQMRPNAVWLAEWLCGALPLKPAMRVLDLGCGRAMTSIFLAKGGPCTAFSGIGARMGLDQ